MLATTQEAQEYRKKFHQYYYDRIVGHLSAFENARKPALSFYTFWLSLVAATIVATIAVLIHLNQISPDTCWDNHGSGEATMQLGALIAAGFFLLAKKVAKDFENKVKTGIIRSFLSFFGDFSWSCKDSISRDDILESGLVGNFNELKSDDYFEGTHRGLKVVISENKLIRGSGKNRSTIFEGLFIQLDINKRFSGHTLIREDNVLAVFEKPDRSMEDVQLEDVEFNKMFNVYADDQTEARFLITAAFIERFKNLRQVYSARDIRASFLNNSLIVAINCKKDMFKLGNVRKPVADTGQMQELFEEFVAVLSLVELLNLDSKTGL